MTQPVCIVIAGPNGAGKTTFALKYLPGPSHCKRFINADLIAFGLSPLAPETELAAAGRLFIREIEAAIRQREGFAYETTLAGRSNLKRIRALQASGWRVVLIYLYLPTLEMSAARVAERVRHGGHDIPMEALLRRYSRSLKNLLDSYSPLCDVTMCLDNSADFPKLIFRQTKEDRVVFDVEIYRKLLSGAGL